MTLGKPPDSPLDLCAQIRADMIQALVEHDMPVAYAADLRYRFRLIEERDFDDCRKELQAIARDLKTLADSQVNPGHAAPKAGLVIGAIKANPAAGDREIARLVGCSAMIVGRTKAKLGLKLDVCAPSPGTAASTQ
jgi:hypothetical protein